MADLEVRWSAKQTAGNVLFVDLENSTGEPAAPKVTMTGLALYSAGAWVELPKFEIHLNHSADLPPLSTRSRPAVRSGKDGFSLDSCFSLDAIAGHSKPHECWMQWH